MHESTHFDPAINMARQSLYRFAALSLVDPRTGSWDQLHALRNDPLPREAADLIRSLPAAQPRTLGLGERPLVALDPQLVLNRLPNSPEALNSAYENTFGLLVSGACPPYEMEYINSKFAFQRSNALADIGGFYQAFGLTTSADHPERHDHIALELEFMALLLGLERQAANGAANLRQDRLSVCRAAQQRFLKEHLAWWVPAFARLLAKESGGGFYAAVGIFLAALIPAERALLKVEIESHHVSPSQMERPESCDGCQLVS